MTILQININRIKYNDIGLVDSIVFDSDAKIAYTYGLNGEKLKVVHRVLQSNLTGTDLGNGLVIQRPIQIEYNTREYLGGDVELEGESWIYGKTYKYYFGDGYVQFYPGSSQAPRYYFYSKDHLGNIRSVVTKNPTTKEIAEVQQTHYYPFGGIIADLSSGTSVQNKLYNGKELDASNNLWWYDYGARQYDPTAPRFTTPDPLAEKYYGWNMYGYCTNNPIKYIDPDGKKKNNWIRSQIVGYNIDNRDRNASRQSRFSDAIVQIWPHGVTDKGHNIKYIDAYIPYYDRNDRCNKLKEQKITNGKQLNNLLNTFDKQWKDKKTSIIVLHACYSSDLAKSLSADPSLKDATIIAPTWALTSSANGTESVEDSEGNTGHWAVYRNGEELKDNKGEPITYPSTAEPGTVGFDYKFTPLKRN